LMEERFTASPDEPREAGRAAPTEQLLNFDDDYFGTLALDG